MSLHCQAAPTKDHQQLYYTAYRHLRSIVDGSPGASLSAILHQIWYQTTALTTQLLNRFRPTFSASHNDSAFRLLEYFEARIVEDTIHALIARHPTQSLVWLHDGFLVAPPPPEHMVRQIEKEVLSKHQLFFEQPWFKVTPLVAPCNQYIETLKHTASSRVLPSHAAHRSNAPVSSMLPLDPRTFVPPRWKLSPSCALGVNDQRDRVAWFNTGTYARHALPQPFCVERRVLPGVPWVATSACVRIGNVLSEKQ